MRGLPAGVTSRIEEAATLLLSNAPGGEVERIGAGLLADPSEDRFAAAGELLATMFDAASAARLRADDDLRRAADELSGASGETPYMARRQIVRELRGRSPSLAAFALSPERRLCPSPFGRCVEPGRFALLLAADSSYAALPLYRELTRAGIPDEALVPLIALGRHPVDREAWPDDDALEVAKRAGDRAAPAAWQVLAEPEAYGWDLPSDLNYNGTRWLGPSIPPKLFELCAALSARPAAMLFRAFLEAGWNDAARYLPATEWAEMMLAELRDGPYGPIR
ncbi:MAG: hypothetical protein U0166_06520 [Acidobacteriota bacterium]